MVRVPLYSEGANGAVDVRQLNDLHPARGIFLLRLERLTRNSAPFPTCGLACKRAACNGTVVKPDNNPYNNNNKKKIGKEPRISKISERIYDFLDK